MAEVSLLALAGLSLIFFLGYLIQGVTGFGASLFCLPLALLLIDREVFLPLALFFTLVQSLFVLSRNYQQLCRRQLAITLILAVAGGMPLGYLISKADEQIAKLLLAIFILGYAGQQLCQRRLASSAEKPLPSQKKRRALNLFRYLLPVASGGLQTAFGSGGPLLMAYLNHQLAEKHQIRATISAYWVVLNTLILIGQTWREPERLPGVLPLLLRLAPAVILGALVGSRLAQSIDPDKFKTIVNQVLLASALLILGQALCFS